MWASRHEDLWSDGGVAPHVFDHLVVPDRDVVLARCNPLGSAMAVGLDAAARARRAARAADGDVRDSQFCMSSPATTAWCLRLDASASQR